MAGNRLISAEDDSGAFAEVGNVEEVALASMGLADSSGVMAADTAALVPNFNASRRLILFIRSSQTPRNNTILDMQCSGRSLDQSSNSRNLARNQQLLCERHSLLSLRSIIQFTAREIATAAALPRELGEHLLQQNIHVFPGCRMLRKKQMSIARLA